MSTPHPDLEGKLTPETLSEAHLLRELLVGVSALLTHPHRREAVVAAFGAANEARAAADRLVAQLDALASIQIEAERAERAHRVESARVHTALPVGGLR